MSISKSSVSGQMATPIGDKLLEYLHDYMIFAPQFFQNVAGENKQLQQIKQTANDRRPKMFDASKYIKRPYQRGETLRIPNIPRLHAQDKQEGVEISDQGLTIGNVSLTITMHKYVSVVIEDGADAYDNISLADDMIKREAKALAEAFEDSVLSLFDDFTSEIGSGVGDVITFDDFATMNKTFFKRGVNLDHTNAWAVLTPEQYAVLATQRDEYQFAADKALGTFNSGRIIETPHGIYALRSNRLQSSGGAASGLCFTENAMMAAFAILPRGEKSRDSRKVGTRYYADFMAGVAKLRDEEGIHLNFDSDSAV